MGFLGLPLPSPSDLFRPIGNVINGATNAITGRGGPPSPSQVFQPIANTIRGGSDQLLQTFAQNRPDNALQRIFGMVFGPLFGGRGGR